TTCRRVTSSNSFSPSPGNTRGRFGNAGCAHKVIPLPSYGGGAPSHGAEGEGSRDDLEDHDLKSAGTSSGAFPLRPFGPPPPYDGCRIHTSLLRGRGKLDSLSVMMADGEVDVRHQVWTGAVWRRPPGKRGACLHAALVARPG